MNRKKIGTAPVSLSVNQSSGEVRPVGLEPTTPGLEARWAYTSPWTPATGRDETPHRDDVLAGLMRAGATLASNADGQAGRKPEGLSDAAEVLAVHDQLRLRRVRGFVLVDSVTSISLTLAIACLAALALSVVLTQDERHADAVHADLVVCRDAMREPRSCVCLPEAVIEVTP